MVDHGAADHKGVAEMHARHRSKRVDEVSAHPDGCCVVVTDRVEKAVFWWEEPWWHAWIKGEC